MRVGSTGRRRALRAPTHACCPPRRPRPVPPVPADLSQSSQQWGYDGRGSEAVDAEAVEQRVVGARLEGARQPVANVAEL